MARHRTGTGFVRSCLLRGGRLALTSLLRRLLRSLGLGGRGSLRLLRRLGLCFRCLGLRSRLGRLSRLPRRGRVRVASTQPRRGAVFCGREGNLGLSVRLRLGVRLGLLGFGLCLCLGFGLCLGLGDLRLPGSLGLLARLLLLLHCPRARSSQTKGRHTPDNRKGLGGHARLRRCSSSLSFAALAACAQGIHR